MAGLAAAQTRGGLTGSGRPAEVVVSNASVSEWNPTPRSPSSVTGWIRCDVERPSRHTPACSPAEAPRDLGQLRPAVQGAEGVLDEYPLMVDAGRGHGVELPSRIQMPGRCGSVTVPASRPTPTPDILTYPSVSETHVSTTSTISNSDVYTSYRRPRPGSPLTSRKRRSYRSLSRLRRVG